MNDVGEGRQKGFQIHVLGVAQTLTQRRSSFLLPSHLLTPLVSSKLMFVLRVPERMILSARSCIP